MMSKGAKEEIDLETRIEQLAHDLLYDVLVFGKNDSFGLCWRTGNTEFAEDCVGGWLNVLNKGSKNLHFFVVDDELNELRKQKSDNKVGKVQRIRYSDVTFIHTHVSSKKSVPSIVIETEEVSWRLAPVQEDDIEIIANWVACLRHRTKSFSDELLAAHNKALKAVVSLQSHYRRKRAYAKFQRRKKRRQGISNILASTVNAWIYGGDGYFDTDSDDEENEDDNKRRVVPKSKNEEANESVFQSMVSAVMYDLYSQAFGAKDLGKKSKKESDDKPKSVASMTSVGTHETLRLRSSKLYNKDLSQSGRVQQKYLNKPADPDEVEDEVWEVQKWEITSKVWKHLFFSDRLYLTKAESSEGVFQYNPLDWIVTKDLTLDLSGLSNNSCGNNGWVFASSLRSLMMQHALGKAQMAPSTSTIFRRRRWFQRRRRTQPIPENENKVVWHGYLALKTELGRWQPYYFSLNSGLLRDEKMTGITLVQFKHRVKDFKEYVHTGKMSTWNSLRTGKQIKIYQLEGAHITRGKKMKSHRGEEKVVEHRKARYSLKIKLNGFKQLTLLVACESRQSREEWYAWLTYLVQQQNKNFTLAKIQIDNNNLVKNEAYDKIPMFKWSVLNRLVACDVDTFVTLAFANVKFQHSLHRKLQARHFDEVQPWSDDLNNNSRRQVTYTLPKQKSRGTKRVSVFPRTSVIHKFKVEQYEPGIGFHMTSSLQMPDLPHGKLLRCLVRTVVSKWKGNNARIFISMEVDSQSQDEVIKEYFESLMRVFMLQYYEETWIPLCSQAVKYTRDKQMKTSSPMKIVTPHGLDYNKV